MNTEPTPTNTSDVLVSGGPDIPTEQNNNQKLTKRKLLIGLLVVLTLVVLVGTALYSRAKNDTAETTNSYSYGELSVYAMPGAKAGQGLSFDKPSTFDKSTEKENSKTEKGFVHTVSKPNSATERIVLSRILATSIDAEIVGTEDYKKALNKIFTAKETDLGYIVLEKNIEQYVKKAFDNPDSINVEISRPVVYTNANVKSNAWVFDIKVTDKSGKIQTQTGKLVYLVGKSARYYFLVTAESENWSSNKDAFDKVTQSLKINL